MQIGMFAVTMALLSSAAFAQTALLPPATAGRTAVRVGFAGFSGVK